MPTEAAGREAGIQPARSRSTRTLYLSLGCAAVLLAGAVLYIRFAPSGSPAASDPQAAPRIIQLDVLNGCGVKGAAAKITSALRSGGFDVVEVKNYKSFGIPHTLVVDRLGDLAAARRVARSLGVADNNVIQQINPDYFVNVSVIIGEDFASLHDVK